MAAGNNIDLVGNLTRDPELRYTPGGMAVATFGLAVNARRQNRQTNEWEERTSFFDVVCWGSLGENVSESLGRGSRVMVVGRLEQRSWENQEGDKRSKIEVIADEVGPSLRWASAEVTKNERRAGGDFGGGPSGPGGGPAGGGGRASRPAGNEPPAYDYDEEPF
jgi:single-strand DNA-binding protein